MRVPFVITGWVDVPNPDAVAVRLATGAWEPTDLVETSQHHQVRLCELSAVHRTDPVLL